VDVNRIDKVMNLTGEIVLVRNRLLNISDYFEARYSSDPHVEGLQEAVSFLDLVTSDIQLAVMKMRMQPIKKVFGKFPRLVRDISQNLGKEVQLNISGEDTEVDRTVIERIGDPMVHIIRNAIDHGIEPVEERTGRGKPARGVVDISAYQQGSHIVIEVSDDGRGIDIERVKEAAVFRGLVSEEEAARMTQKEAANLIFLPGFSTLETATELSGRGVGMDVVKTNTSKLNGYVEVLTTRDVGTTLRISIPLTLAIIQALMVRTGGIQYAIPLGPIEETLKVGLDEIDDVTGSRVIAIRDRVHSIAELAEILGYSVPPGSTTHRYVLVLAIGDRRFCVAVDELLGQEEVVIKAIDGIDTDSTGILGATITGEGKIVLILDPSSLSKMVTGITAV
jgi:two-component system chemotaxis sensor kinase CheA